MAEIKVLDTQSANMIAAGEVVDRPASVVKELVENAIDAGATAITVEIKNGGASLIRVSDNGCGMPRHEMPRSLLRHATSKIVKGTDIATVTTRGFRGEALAAISSVSELEMISRIAENPAGNVMYSDDNGIHITETGCPVGTTVVVQNLFYNTPARRKFMKTDRSEAAACRIAAERQALSCPNIAFKLVSDGELKFSTSGNGKERDAIADIVGIDTVRQLLPVQSEEGLVKVRGFVGDPKIAKGRNNSQNCFVNGRYVISKVVQAATKEAYRTYMPRDSYPVTYIYLETPPEFVDVNVHPAKTEVKFYDDQKVYEAVYYAVRTALEKTNAFVGDSSDIFVNNPYQSPTPAPEPSLVPSYEQAFEAVTKTQSKPAPAYEEFPAYREEAPLLQSTVVMDYISAQQNPPLEVSPLPAYIEQEPPQLAMETEPPTQETLFEEEKASYKYIGELYNAFLVAETDGVVYIVDKHAAHERILYEQFKSAKREESQELFISFPIYTDPETAQLMYDNREYFKNIGYNIDDCHPLEGAVYFSAFPPHVTRMPMEDLFGLLESFAEQLSQGNKMPIDERLDRALFTMACKAALKAGIPNDEEHNKWILDNLFNKKSIKYCPHGRPVAKAFDKREVLRWFDR